MVKRGFDSHCIAAEETKGKWGDSYRPGFQVILHVRNVINVESGGSLQNPPSFRPGSKGKIQITVADSGPRESRIPRLFGGPSSPIKGLYQCRAQRWGNPPRLHDGSTEWMK